MLFRSLGVLTAMSLLMGLTGCGLLPSGGGDATAAKDGGKGGGKGRGKGGGGAVPVLVANAQRRGVPVEVQVVGTAEAYASNSVKAQVAGQVMEQFFTEGDFVKKGDKLFSIDDRPIAAQIRTATVNMERSKALLAQAEATLQRDTANATYQSDLYERTKKLIDQGITAKETGEQLKSQAAASAQLLNADRAAIERAKDQIQADQAAIYALNVQLSYTTV